MHLLRRQVGRRSRVAGLILLALLQALALAGVYYLTVRTSTGRLFGDASLRGALSTSPLVDDTVDTVLDVVSVASLLGAVAVVAVIALLRLARLQGVLAIGILATANLSSLLLKSYLLPRPDLGLDEVGPATLNSLPSGHSTAAFSAVAALVFVMPRRWRLPAAALGTAYAALTGVATLSAGWHRAGDSMASFLVVGFWTSLAAAVVMLRHAGGLRPVSAAAVSVARWSAIGALGCLILGSALAAALGVTESLRQGPLGTWTAFLTGVLLIIGAAVAVMLGVVRAAEVMDSRALQDFRTRSS